MPDNSENSAINESSFNYVILDGGENIGKNQDFNDYTIIGNYDINTAEDVSTAQNMPVNSFGRLIVSIPGTVDTTYCYRRQDFIPYTTLNAILYTRYARSEDEGETWIWRPWMTVQDTLYAATPIDSDSNLNSFINPGAFVIRTTPLAATILNIPIDEPGRLFVMDMLGSYERITNDVYVRQFFVPNDSTKNIYSRDGNSTNYGSTWSWQEWQIIGGNNAPTTYVSTINGMSGDVTIIAVPAFTTEDNDKILGVVNGQLSWVDKPTSEPLPIYVSNNGKGVVTITNTSFVKNNGTIIFDKLTATDDGAETVIITTPVISI